jgi:hypothetical protein
VLRLAGGVANATPMPGELNEAIRELQTHQIELQLQNEALRDAQLELAPRTPDTASSSS